MTRAQKRLVLLLIDLCFVPVAFAAAFTIQYSTVNPLRSLTLNWPLIPLLVVVALGLALSLRTAHFRLKQYDLAAAQRTALFAALLAVSSGALAALGKLGIPPGFHVIFGLVFFALSAGSRIVLLHILLAIYRQSRSITRVMIYGAGRTGMTIATALRNQPDIIPVAFLDDNATLRDLIVAGLPVFPGIQLERLLGQYRVDRIILAMPSLSVHKQTYLSRRLEKLGLEVQTLPAFAQLTDDDELLDKLTPVRAGALLSRPHLHNDLASGCAGYADTAVMISGAGGSIGLELCRQIAACQPSKLVLLEMSEYALYNAERELRLLAEGTPMQIVPVLGSVADGALVEKTLRDNDVSVVFHAAAYKHVPLVEANACAGVANNSLATAVLAQKARACGVRRFVLISSDKAVRPANVMGASKRLAELIVQGFAEQNSKTIFSIVRFGNVLGSSGSVVPLFQEQIARGGPITLTDDGVTRYFMTIQEAARLVLTAGSFAKGGEVFVLDMGAPVLVRDLAKKLIVASGYSVRDKENPAGDIEIVTIGLRPGEKMHEELTVAKASQTTAHPKINSVRESRLSELELAAALRGVRDAIEAGDDTALEVAMRRWVKDYRTESEAAPVAQRDTSHSVTAGERHHGRGCGGDWPATADPT